MDKRTYKDRREYLIKAVKRRRRELRKQAVNYAGGKCILCNYNKCLHALEFHHKDPTQKDFGISNGNCNSWNRMRNEIDKCILVCANCHREIHEKLASTHQGDGS
jgi:predicted HNH restriction endonuclease